MPEASPPAPPPPPYSLPWQLRPVTVGNVVRSDTAVAFFKNGDNVGSTVATTLLATYKLTPNLAPLVRLGFVQNSPIRGGWHRATERSVVREPHRGRHLRAPRRPTSCRWLRRRHHPRRDGGGDTPDAGAAQAVKDAPAARSAMDNAMFAVNYFTAIGGVDAAFVAKGFTAQIEATVFQLARVRGENAASATDSARTNSTAGLHLGYFVIPQLAIAGELRYQRWLSTPTRKNAMTGAVSDIPDVNKDTMTVAVGPRAVFKIGKAIWFRPGIAYARGLDQPLSTSSYNMVQVDLPVAF